MHDLDCLISLGTSVVSDQQYGGNKSRFDFDFASEKDAGNIQYFVRADDDLASRREPAPFSSGYSNSGSSSARVRSEGDGIAKGSPEGTSVRETDGG
jgi:hypothetical protein